MSIRLNLEIYIIWMKMDLQLMILKYHSILLILKFIKYFK
jgi:hypothetical protein